MNIVLLILGIISFIYYIGVSCYVGFGPGLYIIWLLLAVFLWINAWFFRKNLWKKVPKWGLRIYQAVIILGLLCFLIPEIFIVSGMWEKPEEEPDYVIVLGAQVSGTTITRSLKYRLDAALDYYQDGHEGITFVLSGGQGEGEHISEAEAMREYLMSKGVPEEQMLLEEQSTTTQENMEFSYRIISENLSQEVSMEQISVAVCTNDFHVFRAGKLAESAGDWQVSGLAGASDIRILPMMLVREAAAVWKEVLQGNF